MYGFREDFDPDNRVVKQEEIIFKGKTYLISTVDLGLNHRFGEGKPLWYETMIFPKKPDGTTDFYDLFCDRYSTKEEALKGHEAIKEKIAKGEFDLEEILNLK